MAENYIPASSGADLGCRGPVAEDIYCQTLQQLISSLSQQLISKSAYELFVLSLFAKKYRDPIFGDITVYMQIFDITTTSFIIVHYSLLFIIHALEDSIHQASR